MIYSMSTVIYGYFRLRNDMYYIQCQKVYICISYMHANVSLMAKLDTITSKQSIVHISDHILWSIEFIRLNCS